MARDIGGFHDSGFQIGPKAVIFKRAVPIASRQQFRLSAMPPRHMETCK